MSNNYYDKTTLKEYGDVRNKIIKDMSKYIRGELKGKELTKYKELNRKANELQRELDSQYMSAKHKNDNSFWDNWTKIHN